MTILTEALKKHWSFANNETEDPTIHTESFLKSALSIARDLEDHMDSEEFDKEFLEICSQCQTGKLSGHL